MWPPRTSQTPHWEEVARQVANHAKNRAWDLAYEAAAPLLEEQRRDASAAAILLSLVDGGAFDQHGLDVAKAVFEAHPDEALVVAAAGNVFPALHDIRYLNAEPPADPFFASVASR